MTDSKRLTLTLALDRSVVSIWEAATVTLELSNVGPDVFVGAAPPSTAACTFVFRNTAGEVVLEARDPPRGGFDSEPPPPPAQLAPNDAWTWTIHLAQYMAPLAAGVYEMRVAYRDDSGAAIVESDAASLVIEASAPRGVQTVSDRPTLFRTLTLVHDDRDQYFIRQQDPATPQRPSYAHRLALPEDVAQVILGEAGFFTASSFAHVHSAVLLCRAGLAVRAVPVVRGQLGPALHQGTLAPDRIPLPTAAWDPDGSVTFACWAEGALEICRLGPAGVQVTATVRPTTAASHVCLAKIKGELHVVLSGRTLEHVVLDCQGTKVRGAVLGPFRHRTRQLMIERKSAEVRAVFDAGVGSRELCCVTLALRSGALRTSEIDGGELDGEISEFAFGGGQGNVVALAGTDRGMVSLIDHNGIVQIGQGQDPCFPVVLPGNKTFVGYAAADRGLQYRQAGRQ